ncbi:MAG: methyltransferase domain-containing protein [bacterium]|nr:methyltransferase domain-containing protein [bacterium]
MFRPLARLLRLPNKLAFAGLVRGMAGQVQLGCVSALLRCGALATLGRFVRVEEIARTTGLTDIDMLRSLCELGVRRGVLRRQGDRYRAKSALARALAADPTGPMASMVHEVTTYHLDVLRQLPERLRGAPPADHLAEFGPVVAKSSRIMDHWLRGWIERLLATRRVRSVLDLGCGSGAMLACVAAIDPALHGLGLDLDEAVVADARSLLAQQGLLGRFDVRAGDLRDCDAWPARAYDLVTANQNVYYFDADERTELWRRAREHLTDGGCLSIVSAMAGGPMSDYFDLILGSTTGCLPLPTVEQVESELQSAGLCVVRKERLIPGDTVYGLAAETTC